MTCTKRGSKFQIVVDDYERRTLIGILAEMRNQCLQNQKPTEDINVLLEKTLDADTKKDKEKAKDDR